MRVEFDPEKDRINQYKHGVSLALAASLDWDATLFWIDERRDDGETRILALAPDTGVVYFGAFVDRTSARRVFSLRRANRREVRRYVQATQDPDPDA